MPKIAENDDYQAQSDADTLTRASEIHADGDRHAAAVEHLSKKAAATKDAHKSARKELEKRTKKRLKKTFAEGSPQEEATESAAEAKAEGDTE